MLVLSNLTYVVAVKRQTVPKSGPDATDSMTSPFETASRVWSAGSGSLTKLFGIAGGLPKVVLKVLQE